MTKKYLILGGLLFLVIILFVIVYLNFFKKIGQDSIFTITKGESTREVAAKLHEKNLIFSPTVFSFFVYSRHIYLQPGDHDLKASMNFRSLIKALSLEGNQESVTIPEGYRANQIDELLTQKKLIAKGAFNQITINDEGRLFPDTYRFKKDVTAAEIRQAMMDNFKQKTDNLAGGQVTEEILILASIVEREAKFDTDRAKIAGVYRSRLDIGMKLQADPTIQYGKGSWAPITVADYSNFKSSYNTYLHGGLPPTPICNPGLKSIEAALSPDKDGSLYFFTDGDGRAVFSKTLVEHQAKLKN